jgi:hypothetical protein
LPIRPSRLIAPLIVVVSLAWSTTGHAGAWTQGGFGHFTLSLGNNNYFATKQFDPNGNQLPIRIFQYVEGSPFAAEVDSAYKSNEFFVYAEFGIFKQLDLIFYLPFWKILTQTYPDYPDFQVGGVGDGNLWLRANFINNKYIVMSLRGGIEVALGNPRASAPYPDPFQSKRLPIPLGDREVAGDIAIQVARSFHPVPLYIAAEVGGRFRGSHQYGDNYVTYANAFEWALELGLQIFIKKYIWCWLPEIDFMINFRGVASVGDGQITGPPPTGYSYNLYLPPAQTYMQLGPAINIRITKYGFISARYERVLWGKNTGVGDIVGVSIGFNR